MSNLLRQVALVPDDNIGGALSLAELGKVAAALQKQVSRDLDPIWSVSATVDAFASLDDVPIGYWPILIGEEGQGGGGVHLDQDNQPFALVDFTPEWTVTTSHECLEMLVDPSGNRLVAGDSPNPARPGRVEFLVEVCDPCEVPNLGYTVNGIRVSDFYTPRYFDPANVAPHGGKIYDFVGHITAPRQVLRGGYLSWREGDGEWFQELFFGAQPVFKSLGKFDNSFGSLRAWIDNGTQPARMAMLSRREGFAQGVLSKLARTNDDNDYAGDSSRRRAASLRTQITSLRSARPGRRSAKRSTQAAAPGGGRSHKRRGRK